MQKDNYVSLKEEKFKILQKDVSRSKNENSKKTHPEVVSYEDLIPDDFPPKKDPGEKVAFDKNPHEETHRE
ncbi:hypothetical protein [Nitrosomonas sp.]|uniref:hypothetical protein n=1 Tax=Nitrosomonas sp. TaxID=42353 RepID=UPI0025F1784A|nr:hypothetical protein [Nitrosomonas sp.]MBY0485521.1 hypothetical protein [Nitrosomonas sp.]